MNTPLTNNQTTLSATNGQHSNAAAPVMRPDPQVQERPTRRRSTTAYKARILKEAARQCDARRLAALEAENHKLRVLLELQKSSGLARPLSGRDPQRSSLIQEASVVAGIRRACAAVA